jgi:hypothetical protein
MKNGSRYRDLEWHLSCGMIIEDLRPSYKGKIRDDGFVGRIQ